MAQRLSPRSMFNRLRSTYWFLPSVVTISIVVLSFVLLAVDQAFPNLRASGWLSWAYGGGPAGARAVLSAVAGSTVTVVSVTFSVMVVALTVSSQHFGPRLLNSFMRDTGSQLVLGLFAGTFAYCLIVLRTVQGDGGEEYEAFVPHLAVTTGVILALASVATLIYYVHHIATSMQVSEITIDVRQDLEDAIDRLYPERFGLGIEPPIHEPPAVPEGAFVVSSATSGYVQEIDSERVLALASDENTTIWLTARPGDFVIEEMPIAAAHPPPRDPARFKKALGEAYSFGTDRTSYQDVGFAVQQLVEVALRGLSPGINEPFTAITCIDHLGQGLSKLASRRIPSGVRKDDTGDVRVVTRPRRFETLVREAFEPIAVYAERNPAISERLLQTLGLLATAVRRDEDRRAVRKVASYVWTHASRHVEEQGNKEELARLHEAVRRILDGRQRSMADHADLSLHEA